MLLHAKIKAFQILKTLQLNELLILSPLGKERYSYKKYDSFLTEQVDKRLNRCIEY